MNGKKYLSLEEAAQLLGLRSDEVIRLREKGELRGFADRGTWKFKSDDIAEYRRSQQPDSDPDLAIMDDFDDEESHQTKVIHRGIDAKSDSDVRLIASDTPKKKVLSGSSGEVDAMELHSSDSDVRLVEQKSKAGKKGSDSDVKIVKPKAETESDSDSDVKMVSKTAPNADSDSDVKVLRSRRDPSLPGSDSDVQTVDSDSDVKPADSDSDVRMAESDSDVRIAGSDSDIKLANSDSDVRLASLSGSDSDVKLISKSDPETDSDSDVKLLLRGKRGDTSQDLPLMPVDFDLDSSDDAPLPLAGKDSTVMFAGRDSGIKLSGDSGIKLSGDSGIKLAGDSGIKLAGDSGIKLAGDSGIQLAEDSGVQLIQPADSGISLEGMDSAVRFADSGITMGADSGIRLGGSSGNNLTEGKPKKRKGESDTILKGLSSKDIHRDDFDSTSPMLLPADEELSDELDFSDTSELQAMSESDQSVVLFEDEEDEAPAPKSKKKPASDSDLFEEADDELEMTDADLSDGDEFGDLDFDDRGDDLDESFSAGSSREESISVRKVVAKEVEWGTDVFFLLFTSICVLIVGSMVSADLLRTVWAKGLIRRSILVLPG